MELFARARLVILAAEAHNIKIAKDSLMGQARSHLEIDRTDAETEAIDPVE